LGWINDYTKEQDLIYWERNKREIQKGEERNVRFKGASCAACIVRVARLFVGITVGELKGMVGRKYKLWAAILK
jgi:hypothetical protein